MKKIILTEEVKAIKIDVETVGARGIINFDGSEQKNLYNGSYNYNSRNISNASWNFAGYTDNIKLGKGIFGVGKQFMGYKENDDGKIVVDDNGNPIKEYKDVILRRNIISNESFKQMVFSKKCPYNTTDIWYKEPDVVSNYLANPIMISKGYLGLAEETKAQRNSMLNFTNLKIDDVTLANVAFGSTNTISDNDGDKATSIHNKETCDECVWTGSITLMCCGIGNIVLLNNAAGKSAKPLKSTEGAFLNAMQNSFNDNTLKIGDYISTNSLNPTILHGILLNEKSMATIANTLIKEIRDFDTRTNAGGSSGNFRITAMSWKDKYQEYHDIDLESYDRDEPFGSIAIGNEFREATKEEIEAFNNARLANENKAKERNAQKEEDKKKKKEKKAKKESAKKAD
ncbi:MAG: hypothetical protein MJZ34_07250 [Paludibacteraceae bacterium]|nr:hypothetical protein [Paludibacteraceae bacterium]